MKKICIDLKYHKYNIEIGSSLVKSITGYINEHHSNTTAFLLVDKSILKIHKDNFINPIIELIDGKTIVYPFLASEKNKTYDSIIKIHAAMQKKKLGRDSLLIAIGGGITGDVGGFAASTYMRGIPYIQIPTTLLAAVDSSVGGKTGINFNGAKNFIGSFYQPEADFIDTSLFSSLLEEEIICGTGEVLKYAFLTDIQFYNYLKRNIDKLISLNKTTLQRIIEESVKFKAAVVIKDEKESGLRKVLNLGHTFAHAFESTLNHKIKHGQAVIVGLTAALHLSFQMGLLNEKNLLKYLSLLVPFSEFIKLKINDPAALYNAMYSDKKNRRGKIKFVLLEDIGKILLDVECPKEKVIKSIEFALQYFS